MSETEKGTFDAVTFGHWLRDERTKKNISLEEIAAVTKVHITQLKNLEDGIRDRLPAPAFVRGFLLSYARHLNLNEDEVLSRFKEGQPQESGQPLGRAMRAAQSSSQPKVRLVEGSRIGHAPASKDLEKPQPALLKGKNIALIALGLALIVGVGMLISLGKKHKKARKEAAQVSEVASTPVPTTPPPAAAPTPEVPAPTKAPEPVAPKAAPAVAAKPTPAAPAEATAPGSKKFSLELHAIEQSWVNVRIDDKDSSGMILAPGKAYPFEADRRVILSLSDAGSVEIKWNGTWYAPPGFRGDVRSLTLPDQLNKLTPRALAPKPKVPKPKPAVAPAEPVPEEGNALPQAPTE
ncbi:MAG: DUF4115 domain-containing protein [Bdellovibrionales bacterium]|nr:DUF4115 domain-containing protein [Bdellovibrionales bacterium]